MIGLKRTRDCISFPGSVAISIGRRVNQHKTPQRLKCCERIGHECVPRFPRASTLRESAQQVSDGHRYTTFVAALRARPNKKGATIDSKNIAAQRKQHFRSFGKLAFGALSCVGNRCCCTVRYRKRMYRPSVQVPRINTNIGFAEWHTSYEPNGSSLRRVRNCERIFALCFAFSHFALFSSSTFGLCQIGCVRECETRAHRHPHILRYK